MKLTWHMQKKYWIRLGITAVCVVALYGAVLITGKMYSIRHAAATQTYTATVIGKLESFGFTYLAYPVFIEGKGIYPLRGRGLSRVLKEGEEVTVLLVYREGEAWCEEFVQQN